MLLLDTDCKTVCDKPTSGDTPLLSDACPESDFFRAASISGDTGVKYPDLLVWKWLEVTIASPDVPLRQMDKTLGALPREADMVSASAARPLSDRKGAACFGPERAGISGIGSSLALGRWQCSADSSLGCGLDKTKQMSGKQSHVKLLHYVNKHLLIRE